MTNKGLLIAGAVMVGEGAALAIWGRHYVDFMQRHGLMDILKRLYKKLDLQSHGTFAAIGAAEAVWGLVLLDRARNGPRQLERAQPA
jgi:hypothetical protein